MGSFCTRTDERVAAAGLAPNRPVQFISMFPSRSVSVRIDLPRVLANAQAICEQVGVEVIAVIKADAYGLGAVPVAQAIKQAVNRFCIFSLADAIELKLWECTARESIAIGPPDSAATANDYLAAHVRPAVSTPEQAKRLAPARPILMVDSGMQRFACPAEKIDDTLLAGACEEAMTHATTLEQVATFKRLVGQRGLKLHAAGSSLLHLPEARFDAVRPGIALYRGAVHVTTRLVEVQETRGPAGYSGFTSSTGRHGVILAGYANGFRKGMCLVNGDRRPVVETGMQSAFVEIGAADRVGDEVTLLGAGLTEQDVSSIWGTSAHEVVLRLTGLGKLP